jgi:hypothetical protein
MMEAISTIGSDIGRPVLNDDVVAEGNKSGIKIRIMVDACGRVRRQGTHPHRKKKARI